MSSQHIRSIQAGLTGLNRLAIGHRADGLSNTFKTNGHIRRLRYWPRRLADSFLQQITA